MCVSCVYKQHTESFLKVDLIQIATKNITIPKILNTVAVVEKLFVEEEYWFLEGEISIGFLSLVLLEVIGWPFLGLFVLVFIVVGEKFVEVE